MTGNQHTLSIRLGPQARLPGGSYMQQDCCVREGLGGMGQENVRG